MIPSFTGIISRREVEQLRLKCFRAFIDEKTEEASFSPGRWLVLEPWRKYRKAIVPDKCTGKSSERERATFYYRTEHGF